MVLVDYFIIALVLGLFLKLFIKNRVALLIVLSCLVLGLFLFVDHLKYTTFTDLYEREINEDSEVERITITVNQLSEQNSPEGRETVTIEDQEIIQRILDDFSQIELKKDETARGQFREYDIRFVTTNEVREEQLVTEYVDVGLDQFYLNDYKIISETDHLETIQLLVERKQGRDDFPSVPRTGI
jgi:hypothetical protein